MGGRSDDQITGYAMGFAIVMMILYFAFIVIGVIAAILSIGLSLVAIAAIINGEVDFLGEPLTREEGKRFISNGFTGLVCLWVFLFLLLSALGFDLDTMRWDLISAIGYAGGSIGTELVEHEISKEKEKEAAAAAAAARLIQPPPPVKPEAAPRPSNVIYPFANWRDDD